MLLLYVGLLGLTYYGFTTVPGGFIPNQDKGYLIVNVQLPDSASLERTVAVMDRIQKIVAETPGVAHTVDIPGQSFVMNGVSSNFGSHVRHPQAVPRTPLAGPVLRGDRDQAARAASGRRSSRPSSWSSGARPWTASATPAASS